MRNTGKPEVIVTGIGVTTSVGKGRQDFESSLFEGRHGFGILKRPGRQQPGASGNNPFLGAEIGELTFPESLKRQILRSASFSAQVAMLTLQEAWDDAGLDTLDPFRIGLVVGGSNFQQRDLVRTYEQYKDKPGFITPSYALSFFDSDLCGICTQQFGIRGMAYTVGGASASGQLAIIHAIQTVQSGMADVCIALGALTDLSYWECQSLRAMGAMGSDRYAAHPDKACRPFDAQHDGFIYGEACGVVVVERADSARTRRKPYAMLTGWAVCMDGNRNPNPSEEGEVRVINQAMEMAGIKSREVDYVNPHGTGSLVGDEVELKALKASGLSHAFINATKSITGHGLSAAGAVEVIATLLQMQSSRLHPTRNLEDPVDKEFNWIYQTPVSTGINHALNLSIGFGGINTALCLKRYE